jgi:predicted nucleic acid-binding protein
MILCDTNIIIEALKGDDKTIKIKFKRFQIHRWVKASKIDLKFINRSPMLTTPMK